MQAEADYAAELVKPIAGKCLALLEGNHEWEARKYYARNIYGYIVQRIADLGGKDAQSLALGAGGFISINFRRHSGNTSGHGWNFDIFAHHGYGGGRLPGGHALTLGRTMGDFDADLYLMGHRHVLQIVPKIITAPDHRGSRSRQRFGVFMPSYLDSFIPTEPDEAPIDTYPELIGLPATLLGAFPIEITPACRKITLHVDYQQA